MYKVIITPVTTDVVELATKLRNTMGIPLKRATELVSLGGTVMQLKTETAAVLLRDTLVGIGLPASIQLAGNV